MLRVLCLKLWGSGSQISPCNDGHICFLYSNSNRCKRTKCLQASSAIKGKEIATTKILKKFNVFTRLHNSRIVCKLLQVHIFEVFTSIFCCSESRSCCGCQCLYRLFVRLWRFICDYQGEWTSHLKNLPLVPLGSRPRMVIPKSRWRNALASDCFGVNLK